MNEYKFEAILHEKSEITITVEAENKEEALKKVEQRDFSQSNQCEYYYCIMSDIERIRLVATREA